MTDWLNIPLQTYDITTPAGRDGLREVVNKVGTSKTAIVASIVNERPQIFISYTLGYVPDSKAADGSEGLEGILVVYSGYFSLKEIINSDALINDLIEKTSMLIDIAEQNHAKGRIDPNYSQNFPDYVETIKKYPIIGIYVKISSEPINLEII